MTFERHIGEFHHFHDYIRSGLESKPLDPDGGVNVEHKRRELVNPGGFGSVDMNLTVSFPNDGWTKSLIKLPDVRFPSIYQHFIEKSLVVAARMSLASVGDDSDASSDTELFSSVKGIDKGYNFFRSGRAARVSGCCNHVATLLYPLEDFVRFRPQDEEESPTSRLCK